MAFMEAVSRSIDWDASPTLFRASLNESIGLSRPGSVLRGCCGDFFERGRGLLDGGGLVLGIGGDLLSGLRHALRFARGLLGSLLHPSNRAQNRRHDRAL